MKVFILEGSILYLIINSNCKNLEQNKNKNKLISMYPLKGLIKEKFIKGDFHFDDIDQKITLLYIRTLYKS
jgi:hypothetical protein